MSQYVSLIGAILLGVIAIWAAPGSLADGVAALTPAILSAALFISAAVLSAGARLRPATPIAPEDVRPASAIKEDPTLPEWARD